MIKVIYKNISGAIMNNGHISDFFSLTHGACQGCCLSPLLLILMAEIIGLKICQNGQIEGIEVEGITVKQGQFADVLWASSKFKKSSFDAPIATLKQFRRNTGLNINYNKTEIMRIGSLQQSNAQFYSSLPLTWSDGPVKTLGIQFHSNLSQMTDLNYGSLLPKMNSVYKTWKHRSLKILGKIQVVNMIMASLSVYTI